MMAHSRVQKILKTYMRIKLEECSKKPDEKKLKKWIEDLRSLKLTEDEKKELEVEIYLQ